LPPPGFAHPSGYGSVGPHFFLDRIPTTLSDVRNSIVLALCLSAVTSPAQSQASPYVALDDWMMPVIEQLIRSGVIVDPDPLTRPLRRADLLAALDDADMESLPGSIRRSIERLQDALEPVTENHMWFEGYAGATGGTHGRRHPLREGGNGAVSPQAGLRGTATFGSVVASSHIYVDQRLDDDPDFTGNKDKWLTHRITDAYLSLQFEYGEVFFGSVDRNWGPTGISGSLVSPEPYSYDHVMLRLGSSRIGIQSLLTDLDSYQDPSGVQVQRWWVTHRVMFRPWQSFVASLSQATLWVGVGRGVELRWLNPLKLSRSTALDEPTADSSNSVYGADFWLLLPRNINLQANFTVDDFGFQFGSIAPDRLIGSAAIDIPITHQTSARASFAFVSSLAYRASRGALETIMRRGIGLGRNFSDYTESTISLTTLPATLFTVTPEVTLLRQGEGDFRQPFPLPPAPDHPFIFEGVIEDTWRTAVRLTATLLDHLDVSGHAGVHFIRNSGHVAGEGRTVFVGGFSVHARLGRRAALQ